MEMFEWGKSIVMGPVPQGEQVLEKLDGGYGVGRRNHAPIHNGPVLTLYRNQQSKGYVSFQEDVHTHTVLLHTSGGAGADATGILMKHALRILRKEYPTYQLEMAPAPGAATRKTIGLLANILTKVAKHEGVGGAQVDLAKNQLSVVHELREGRKKEGYVPVPDLNAWDTRVMLETAHELEAIEKLAGALNVGGGMLLSHGAIVGNLYGQHTGGLPAVNPIDWYLDQTPNPGNIGIKIDPASVRRMYKATK
jgi:hypothetical protein